MDIYLIRHTKTATQTGLCYGQSDVALAESFQDDMAKLIAKLPPLNSSDKVYSSPLSRCLLLAQYFSAEVIIDERLLEVNFGDWEGIAFDSIDKDSLRYWTENFVTQPPPNGESFSDLCKRVEHFWQELLTQSCERLFVITHAGVIRALLAVILQCPPANAFQFKIDYGSVQQLRYSNAYVYIQAING
ncbi:MAG: alpha-ribazole phosphatase [Methylococcaceae bacterium]